MADLTLTYDDRVIATLDGAGKVILKTCGRYCKKDIIVDYSGGGSYEIPFDVPAEYQRVEYLDTGGANCRVNVSHSYIAADLFCVKFSGEGPFIGNRSGYNWNMNASTIAKIYTEYHTTLWDVSWRHDWYNDNDPACIAFMASYALNSFDLGGWGNDYPFYGRIYFCYIVPCSPQIESNNSFVNLTTPLSVCLIPCYRKSDGVNGFYDTVNNVFYTSVSGTFIRGPEVN